MKRNLFGEIFIVLLAIILCITGLLFLDEIFNSDIDPLNQEIFSAVLASIFTIAAMTLVMRMQAKQEKEKEYAAKIFEKKIEIYQELLKILFTADDDNILSDSEIQQIENKIGEASIVANAGLVSCFSQFMFQLKIYGCLYPRSMSNTQIEHFINFISKNDILSVNKRHCEIDKSNFNKLFVTIDDLLQGIRNDLNVVEGNIKESVSKFLSIPIDQFKMKRNPNIID